jgi:hypothetical protein
LTADFGWSIEHLVNISRTSPPATGFAGSKPGGFSERWAFQTEGESVA